MVYRFAICDDESTAVSFISELVSKWTTTSGNGALINTFSSAEAFLFNYTEEKAYDILLLDIEMGDIDGVQLAKTVRSENKEVQIVFITGYMDYIADGYEVEALHYLLKPVTESKLFSVLDRAVQKLKRNERALILDCGGEIVRVPMYDIRYLEVRQNYVTVHATQDYTVKKTLGELEKKLDEGFARTGRSFVVNLRYVTKITRTDVYLKDGSSVPLSRGMYDALNRSMINHF